MWRVFLCLCKKLIEPKSKDEDLRRREFIFNIIVSGSIVLAGIINLSVLYRFIKLGAEYKGLPPLILFLVFLFYVFLYFLSRIGYFIPSAYILIGTFFVPITYTLYKWGVVVPQALLTYALIVVISGILISTRFAFVVTLLILFILLLFGYIQINGIIPYDIYWARDMMDMEDIIVFGVTLSVIMLVSWLSNREIEKSLKRARKSEAETKESEKRFRQFFENEPEYCYMISPEGNILDINVSALKALGYKKEEIVGKPLLTTVYAPSSRDKAKSLFMDWKKTGKLRDEELNIITKNGKERIILLSADAVRNAKGEIIHSVSIQRDITERKKAEKALQKERDLLEVKVEERTRELKRLQMEKMEQLYRSAEFGRLSSGLFHDLVNPLTAVSLSLEQMKDIDEKKLADTRTYLAGAISATKRMENFIAAVRKQIAKQEDKTFFSLSEEIIPITQLLSYKAKKADVEITFSPTDDIRTYGDSIKFSQVITNLISNAIDAYEGIERFGRKREVLIDFSIENNVIRLIVQDWGKGISLEHINKICEPFFTTKSDSKDLGIGLSIVKNIIEKDFNGNLKVKSKPGEEATFIVEFPQKQEPPPQFTS